MNSGFLRFGRVVILSLLASFVLAGPATAQPAGATVAADVLTNATVLRMVAAGLPDQVIIAKICASKSTFNLPTDQLIALKGKGVSGAVLATMLEPAPAASAAVQAEMSIDSCDTGAPHYPGVYMYGA